MFRRFTTALLFVCLYASTTHAQEGCVTNVESWGERGITADFAPHGNFVYAADGRGIAVYDVHEPKLITLANVIHTQRPSRMLAFSGNRLVVATAGGVELFEASEDGALRFLDHLSLPATYVATSGSRVAVADQNSLTILDIIGNELVASRSMRTSNAIDALRWSEDLLYVAEHETAVRILDTTGSTLRQIGLIPAQAYDIAASGSRIYLAGGGVGVMTVEVSDPARPRIVGVVDSSIGDFRRIELEGDRLFVQSNGQQVRAYQLNAAGDVLLPATVRNEPATTILAHRGALFVAGTLRDRLGFPTETGSPIRALDGQDLSLIGEFLTRAGGVTGAATDGSFAFVADPPLLRVIDLRTSPAREVASVAYGDDSDRVKIFGRRAIVYGRLEAHIVDISNPLRPRYEGVFHTLGNAPNDVGFSGPYLIEANRASGFHVLDISDPWNPHQLSGLKNDGRGTWFGFASMNGHVYGMMSKGVRVVDIRNPSIAIETGFIDTGALIDVAIVNPDAANALLVILDINTLRIFDLANPIRPVEIHQVEIPPAIEITSEGNTIHALTPTGVVHVDLSTPRAPKVAVRELNLFSPTQIDAAGKIVIADRYALRIIDPGAAELSVPAPAITLSPNGRAGLLSWPTTAGVEYELEFTSSLDSGSVERLITRNGSVAVSLEEPRFVRVRARNACGVSGWSDALTIPSAASGAVVFETSGQAVYVAATGPIPAPTVTVTNRGSSPAEVRMTTDAAALISLPPSFTLAAGERRSVVIPLAEAARNGGAAAIGISGMSGTHRLEIRRIEAGGSRTRVRREALVLPGAGSLAGLNATRWRSDLQLLCSGGCEIEVAYAASVDPSSENSFPLTLRDGELIVLRDIVSLFQRQETSGTISIYGTRLDGVRAALYTYNDSANGRFGQRITSYRHDPFIESDASRSLLLGVAANAASRTNVGLLNLTGADAFATLHLRNVDGTIIASQRFGLAPYASLQIPATTLSAIDEGNILVEADPGVVSFASRVDQKTGDATFSWATPLTESLQHAWPTRVGTFPLTGSIDGAGASRWDTEVQIANLMSGPARFRLAFLPVTAPHRAIFSDITIDGQSMLSATPSELFPSLEHGQLGSIRVESDASFTGWSRLFNVSAAGTYGQFMPLRSTSPSILMSQKQATRERPETIATLFAVAESSEERTNLTLIERAGRATSVTLAVYDAFGAPLAVSRQQLRPFDTLFLTRILAMLGIEGIDAARIDVDAGDGNVDAIGSVVQVRTNDAVTLTTDR